MAAALLNRLGLVVVMTASLSAAASARAAAVQIVISQVAFQKADVKANVGDTIEWLNNDIFDHTSTAKNGGWDVTIPAGKKASIVLKQAGTFEYYCKLHPNMTARLVVGNPPKK